MACGEMPDASELAGRGDWPDAPAHTVWGECGGGEAWGGACCIRWLATIRPSRANGSSARREEDCDVGVCSTRALTALALLALIPARRDWTRSNAALVCCAESSGGQTPASQLAGAAGA
jgi:hypothetical protein